MENIKNFRAQKPSWSTEPEKLNFKVVNDPLERLLNKTIATLETRARKNFNEFDFLTEKVLSGCFQTYRAIRKLVAKDPKFPTQAHILSRTLLDALYVIEAFVEDPEKYPKAYALAGYRMMWEEYKREKKEFGKISDWTDYLKDKSRVIEYSAKIYKLSSEEAKSPKNIKYWPIPSKMLKENIFSKERRVFLQNVYAWDYGWGSALSHFQWAGMSVSVFSSSPEHHWQPGKFESDPVYKSILYLLMIASEIEVVLKLGLNQDLKYLWTIVGSYFKEAKDYYESRFKKLLQNQ